MLEKTCFAYRERRLSSGEVVPMCNALQELYCQKFSSDCKFYQNKKLYNKKVKLANERLFRLGVKPKEYYEGDEEDDK